jgi:TolA protein
MASRRAERSFAFVLSILVHAAIVVALTFSIPLGVSRQAQPNAVVIETVLVNETAVIAEMARIDAEQQAVVEQREDEARLAREESERLLREQEEEQQRLRDEEARIQRETEEALQRAENERIRLAQEAEALAEQVERDRIAAEQLAEQERIAAEQRAEQERIEREAERQRELEEAARLERERVAAEERAREEARIEAERQARIAAIEAETQRAIEAEQQARAAQDSGLREQWGRAIEDRVRRYWNPPPNVAVGLDCVLEVTQLPNGVVVDVEMQRCNTTDQTIIRSIENAVLNASPLPGPPGNVAFERTIIIIFRPDE